MGRFSQLNGYPATRFHEARCPCGAPTFTLEQDDDEGVARRTCTRCGAVQWVGDSAEYADTADRLRSECLCGAGPGSASPNLLGWILGWCKRQAGNSSDVGRLSLSPGTRFCCEACLSFAQAHSHTQECR
ncbi:hypothetical protein D7Y27_07885 [Corallococcus sp. AB004]|nr:hypothetical protein D7Y04_27920 [Corallococcus sp. AB038B]RKI46628.1 hypothetical protein D7Y27_07885 [Corallococcus sp. AB004]